MENWTNPEKPQEPLIEDVDYYIENGLYVFTEYYLEKRGYCCKNGCRHCPYEFKKGAKQQLEDNK